MDPSQSNGSQDNFVPFTKAERIEQLTAVDENIVSMLRTVGSAIQTLGDKTDGTSADMAAAPSSTNDTTVLESSLGQFMNTLHNVHVQMRRQVFGLEEAGIVTLGKQGVDDEDAAATGPPQQKHQQKMLEPDGSGQIGGLDVGLLNSQSNKVERDMEAELWGQAEQFLRQMLEKGGKDGAAGL